MRKTLLSLVAAFALGSCGSPPPGESDFIPATVEKEKWMGNSYILELRTVDGKSYQKIVTYDHSLVRCPYDNPNCPETERESAHIPIEVLDAKVGEGSSLKVWNGALSTRLDGIGYLCTASILIPDQPAVEKEKK